MSHTCVQTALSKVRDAVTLLDNAALDMDSPQYSTHPMHSDVVDVLDEVRSLEQRLHQAREEERPE